MNDRTNRMNHNVFVAIIVILVGLIVVLICDARHTRIKEGFRGGGGSGSWGGSRGSWNGSRFWSGAGHSFRPSSGTVPSYRFSGMRHAGTRSWTRPSYGHRRPYHPGRWQRRYRGNNWWPNWWSYPYLFNYYYPIEDWVYDDNEWQSIGYLESSKGSVLKLYENLEDSNIYLIEDYTTHRQYVVRREHDLREGEIVNLPLGRYRVYYDNV